MKLAAIVFLTCLSLFLGTVWLTSCTPQVGGRPIVSDVQAMSICILDAVSQADSANPLPSLLQPLIICSVRYQGLVTVESLSEYLISRLNTGTRTLIEEVLQNSITTQRSSQSSAPMSDIEIAQSLLRLGSAQY